VKGGCLDEDMAWCPAPQAWPSDEDPLPPEERAGMANPDVALEALYKAHSPRLLRRFARNGTGDEARDLVQEVFFRLVRLGAGRLNSVQRAEAYLSRIAGNLLRDRAKAARRHSAALHEPFDEERARGHDQQTLLEQRDLLNRLEQAMLKLKPRTREIFMAHRLDGLSYAEIAERTGLGVRGVENHISKAIAQLDRMLHRP
jgi:RNA polymerase sigma factor (sigma-70 family)